MTDPERLSICIVTDAYLPSIGGVENHVLYLSTELKRLGHDVVVVTHKPPPITNPVVEQVESPVPVHRLAGGLLVFREHDIAIDPRMVSSFKRFLNDPRPGRLGTRSELPERNSVMSRAAFDIVHGQSEGSYLVYEALAAARRRGITTVLTRHSMLRNKPPIARSFLISLTRHLTRRADGLIAVSRACAEESAGFAGPVRVIPNGVDTDEFRPMPEERRRLRRELGYSDDDVVLGFIGRLHTTKGVPMLLDAFEQLRRGRLGTRSEMSDISVMSRARLLLAGPGPLRAVIEARAKASSGTIALLEPQPFNIVAPLLNALDVFAFPSRGEAFGISLLEAMACGLPSVAFGRWGVKELVNDGETGLLADGPADFSEKLRRLVSDRALRERLGRAARKSVEERFSWPRVAAETVAFYRELIGR
ncbi:MAG: glycosyltransferase family 4 protein [candidate division WOR-3 bacterium]|nr:glycosyltransferase family 4 protein [candidate division WOR-3 bacterium]